MKKLVLLQALSVLGLLIGVFLAPENPIYPFAPDITSMAIIHRTEAIITCVLSGCAAISFFMRGVGAMVKRRGYLRRLLP